MLTRNKKIRDVGKKNSVIGDERPFSGNFNNGAADLVITNLVMDEAAEDKLLQNSMGVENSKSMVNPNANNQSYKSSMKMTRALPPDPSFSLRKTTNRYL